MQIKPQPVRTINAAVEYARRVWREHPERDGLKAWQAALNGQRRPYPALTILHLVTPDDQDQPADEFMLPHVEMPATTSAGQLAREIIALLNPLKMLNPLDMSFGLGKGTGTMVPSFDIPLNPEIGDTPTHTLTLDDALARPAPHPATSGLMPAMRERILLIKKLIPAGSGFHIQLPDMQGPFNLAHAILGEDALTAPYLQPDEFRNFMERVTTFWIAARKTLLSWIEPEWTSPKDTAVTCIAECSVNLVSPELYREHILPHDLKIARTFGALHIHPCSGPHVFHVTLDELPAVVLTEAGWIAKTAAGAITVDKALAAIGDRPIMLLIGQELPVGREEEFIRADLDRYVRNPRLMFSYTGMHWRIKDRPLIRDMHRRLDAYWMELSQKII